MVFLMAISMEFTVGAKKSLSARRTFRAAAYHLQSVVRGRSTRGGIPPVPARGMSPDPYAGIAFTTGSAVPSGAGPVPDLLPSPVPRGGRSRRFRYFLQYSACICPYCETKRAI